MYRSKEDNLLFQEVGIDSFISFSIFVNVWVIKLKTRKKRKEKWFLPTAPLCLHFLALHCTGHYSGVYGMHELFFIISSYSFVDFMGSGICRSKETFCFICFINAYVALVFRLSFQLLTECEKCTMRFTNSSFFLNVPKNDKNRSGGRTKTKILIQHNILFRPAYDVFQKKISQRVRSC